MVKLRTDALFNASDTTFQTVLLSRAMQSNVNGNTLYDENAIYEGSFKGFSRSLYAGIQALHNQPIIGTETTAAVVASALNQWETWGSNAKPSGDTFYTPDSSETSYPTDGGSNTHCFLTSGASTINLALPSGASVPSSMKVGNYIYLDYGSATHVSSGNFSTEKLHGKWWRVTAWHSLLGPLTLSIAWDETWDGAGTNVALVAPVANFFVTQSGLACEANLLDARGMATEAIRTSVQDCVNASYYDGRVAIRFRCNGTGSDNTIHRYASAEAEALNPSAWVGPRMIVNWTDPAPVGVPNVEGKVTLSPAVSAASSASVSVASLATLSEAVQATARVN